jgi:hypothetical protein
MGIYLLNVVNKKIKIDKMKNISLDEILKQLNYSDLRSGRRWCRDNDVLLMKQGKQEFALETNFQEAFERPFITKLKRQHGDEWKMVYNLYKEGNIPALNTLQKATSLGQKAYRPKNRKTNLFKEKLDAALKGKKAA